MRTFSEAPVSSSTMRFAFVLLGCAFFTVGVSAQSRVIHVRQGTERRVGIVDITNRCHSPTTFNFSGTGLQFASIVPEQRLGITLQPGQTSTIEVIINARAFVPTGEYTFGLAVSCAICRSTSFCKQDNHLANATVRVYDQPEFRVRVMLYSGRSDPTFTTRDPRIGDALQKALGGAPANTIPAGRTIRPRTLGYNGIAISAVEDDVPLPLPVVIYNERIEVFASARTRQRPLYHDPSRQLENMVLDLGVALKALTLSEVQEIRAPADRQP